MMGRKRMDGKEKVRIFAFRLANVTTKKSADVLRGQGHLEWHCWLLHVTYLKMPFLLPNLDLDDHRRPPNALMIYYSENYARTITLVHQINSRQCIRIILRTSPSEVSSTACKRT